MIKAVTILTLLFLSAFPLQANAKERLVLVQQTPQGIYDESGSVDPTRILAIGAGVVVGGVAIGSTFNFMGSGLVGALGGGLVADWWYRESIEDDILALDSK